ncbi:MAG: hypothetical protein O6931_03415 [Gammaproteobacteria bacterium]|nr:hypothetical protein [Gammaproteobacteria bacterium]
MKSPIISTIVIVLLAVAAGPYIYFESVAADLQDFAAAYAGLEDSGSEDAQDWLQLARNARNAQQLEVAKESLDKAAGYGLSPIRLGMEKARILIAGDDPDGATTELQKLFDTGFTAVGVLTNDPLIHSLAGSKDYDELVRTMSVQAYPCAQQAGFQDFDFWVGEWDVHLANGTPAGSNIIEPIERGCALTEHWTSASGGTGMSVNYLDKANDEWVQIWNAEGGSQIIIRGGLKDDGMAMQGYIHYVGNGTTAPFRALWTPLPDGRVRQYFEQSNDGGSTWVPWFEGFYSRRNK